MTAILSYDKYDGCTDIVATISRTTALAIAPKWCEGSKLFFAGYNLYAIEDDKAALIETYDEEKDAKVARKLIVDALKHNAMIIVV